MKNLDIYVCMGKRVQECAMCVCKVQSRFKDSHVNSSININSQLPV